MKHAKLFVLVLTISLGIVLNSLFVVSFVCNGDVECSYGDASTCFREDGSCNAWSVCLCGMDATHAPTTTWQVWPNANMDCDKDGAWIGSDCGAPGPDCDDANSAITGPGVDDDGNSATNSCDDDGDGYYDETIGGTGCDDNDAQKNPSMTWYFDGDGDGYWGNKNPCEPGSGSGWSLATLSVRDQDCDDSDVTEHPGVLWVQDEDDDGHIVDTNLCERGTGSGWRVSAASDEMNDCIDTNPAYHKFEYWGLNADGDDYYGTCVLSCGHPTLAYEKISHAQYSGIECDDCDDGDSTEYPGVNWVQDQDNDGWVIGVNRCERGAGPGWRVHQSGDQGIDCEDSNAAIYPGIVNPLDECEICDASGGFVFHNGNNQGKDGDCYYCDSVTSSKVVLSGAGSPYESGDGDCLVCDGGDVPTADPAGIGDSAAIDCKKCAADGSLTANDDTEDPGICKECSGGVIVPENSENPMGDGDCKKCDGGNLGNDDGDTGVTIPCKKCLGGGLIPKSDGEICGTDKACCSGTCYDEDTALCCSGSVKQKSGDSSCGACDNNCLMNQGIECNKHYPTNCKVSSGLFASSYACRECTGGALATVECGQDHNCVFGQCVDSIPSTIWACLTSGPYYVGLSSPVLDPSVLSDVCKGQIPAYNPTCEEWVVSAANLIVPVLPSLTYKVACEIKDLKCGTPLPSECTTTCMVTP